MKLTAESRFIGLVIVGVLYAGTLHASFEPLPVSARAAGMGEAYSAIVDDVYSLYYNPAGVLQIVRPEIGTNYTNLYSGLSDNSSIGRMFLGYAQPLGKGGRKGHIGASYTALKLDSLYKEEAFGITYGREIKRRYNIGGSLKLLNKKIGSDEFTNAAIDPASGNPANGPDPLLSSKSKETAFGIDLGLQYRLTRAYALGVALRNINSPDLALGSESDKAPAVISLAMARRLRTGSLDIEYLNWKGAENNSRFSVGGEKWFKSGIGIRAGGGTGTNDYSTVSAGISYKLESLQFDYAFVLPMSGIEGTLGLQQISLTVRLGKAPVDPLEKQLMTEKENRIRAETEAMYAKAEVDRLKKEIFLLTQSKTDEETQRANKAAEKALQDAEAQKAAAKKQARDSDQRQQLNQYTEALAEYNKKVRAGVNLKTKKRLLKDILNKYRRTGVDTSTVERELKSLQVEESRAKKDFELSMNFYRRLVQQGASNEDRVGMLKRIIEKYKGTGVNIQPALDEMKTLE